MVVNKDSWMRTFTGLQFDFLNIKACQIHILDIAHSLANQCRFTGHIKEFYSVAEHSLIVSHLVPEEFALAGLLHDASEAYLADINKPAKSLLPQYYELEKKVQAAIAKRYDFKHGTDEVQYADNTALIAEAKHLLEEKDFSGWGEIEYDETFVYKSIPLTPRQAEQKFMLRFLKLSGRKLLD